MDFKEIFQTAVAVTIGVLLAQIIAKKLLKIDSWESDSYDDED